MAQIDPQQGGRRSAGQVGYRHRLGYGVRRGAN
jgi:hypothetical protein